MSKNTINFTKENIDSLPLPEAGKRTTYKDSKEHGLQLRVTSNGVKTFCVFRWVKLDNKPERVTLGRYPDMSIEKARNDARKVNVAIAENKNPNDAIREQKAEATFNELFKTYLERWAKPHKKTWDEDIRQFKNYIETGSPLTKKKLSRITRTDIATLHSAIGKTRPITANRVLALISSVFGRAAEWGLWDKANPAQGIRKFPEKSRDRFIQSDELPVFFESLAMETSEQLQDYFMLLLLTGVRRSNLMAMRWDEISFERKEWRIPETKNGTPQVILLDDGQGVIMRILETRKATAKENQNKSPWVFPSNSVTGHLVEPRKGWERVLTRAEIFQFIGLIAEHEGWDSEQIQQAKNEANINLAKSLQHYRKQAEELKLDISTIGFADLRIHDLRRTLGSWMAGTGASTVMIGRQLNHKSPSATAIYSRLQQDPVKEARNKAVSAMLGAGGITKNAEVIEMRKK